MRTVVNDLGTATNGGNREIRIEPNREPYHSSTPKFDVFLYYIDSDNRLCRDMLLNWADFDKAVKKISLAVPKINELIQRRKLKDDAEEAIENEKARQTNKHNCRQQS